MLLLLLFVAIAAMIVVRFFYNAVNRLRDAARKAMGDDSGDTARDYTGRSSRQYSYRGGSTHSSATGGSRASNGHNSSSSHRRQTSSGTTIIDGRAPEQASRKIFAKGEGEYVDFEEEK